MTAERSESRTGPKEQIFTPENWNGFLKHIRELLDSHWWDGGVPNILYSGAKLGEVKFTSSEYEANPNPDEFSEFFQIPAHFSASKVSGELGEGVTICCPFHEDNRIALIYITQLDRWFYLEWYKWDPERFAYGDLEGGTFKVGGLVAKNDGRFLERFLRTLNLKRNLNDEELAKIKLEKIYLRSEEDRVTA